MAETYKVLGQAAPAATTSTDIYTVPAATSTVVSSITIANRSGTVPMDIRVAVSPAGATLANEHYLYYDVAIQPHDTLSLTLGLTLAATDVVRVYSSTANMSANVFGTEIT